MLITRIEKSKNKRYRVYGDDTFLFSLYGKELKRYGIEEKAELSEDVIEAIREEILVKRARERALYLLERRPMTVYMLRTKLRDNDYTEDVIHRTIQFLEEYHYLDDAEYVRMYVAAYAHKKSRRQMEYELLRKGVDRESIQAFFDEYEFSEQECLLRQFEKYTKGKNLQDPIVRQKVFRYFYSKGFDVSVLEKVCNLNNFHRFT